MTRVVVFTDDESYRESFAALERSRTYEVEFYPRSALRGVLHELQEPVVLYYDLEGESEHSRGKTLRFLTRVRPRLQHRTARGIPLRGVIASAGE